MTDKDSYDAFPCPIRLTFQPLWHMVRRPEQSFDPEASPPCPLLSVGSLLYQGLDRLAWWDISGLYWSNQLRPDLIPLFEQVRSIDGPAHRLRASAFAVTRRLLV